ncbi:hypothetical protein GGU10DRAFT_231920, partial [Lentinula aff. detonsa]
QIRRLCGFFATLTSKQHLYPIIHSSTRLPFPSAKHKTRLLALNPKVRIVVSVNHINAKSSAELSVRK